VPDDQPSNATRVPGSGLPGDSAHHDREAGLTGPAMAARLETQPVATTSSPDRAAAVVLPDAWSRAWVVVILGLVLAATVAVFLDLPAPIRPIATIAFVLLGPGIAIARLLRLDSHLAEFTLGLALGIAIGGLLTGVMLYLGLWSPTRAFVILAAVAIGALALDPNLVPRTAWRQLWRAGRGRARFLAGMQEPPHDEGAETGAIGAPGAVPAPATPVGGVPPLVAPQPPPSATVRDTLPPPPVSIVRRGPRRSPVAVPPPRSGRRRQAFGDDPLDEPDVSRRLRATIDEVIDDLADRKDEPPT
jgi:hypothetical protein